MPEFVPIIFRSYAKINLYLDVLRRRRDGYHNIETIFQTVGLYDEITFWDDTFVSMTCSGLELDTGPSNLVRCAVALLHRETGIQKGVRIHLHKNIPIAAGLAGGSGNAAATLMALNKLWGLRLSFPTLVRYGRMLGADVPYCLHGGTMGATLRGECLFPLPPLHRLWFVLVHPPVAVSAAHVYNHPLLQKNEIQPFAGRTATFRRAIQALSNQDYEQMIFNCMERPVFEEHHSLVAIKDALLEAGCFAAAMSGSGPTLFGICRSRKTANRVAEIITASPLDCTVSVVEPISLGVEQVS